MRIDRLSENFYRSLSEATRFDFNVELTDVAQLHRQAEEADMQSAEELADKQWEYAVRTRAEAIEAEQRKHRKVATTEDLSMLGELANATPVPKVKDETLEIPPIERPKVEAIPAPYVVALVRVAPAKGGTILDKIEGFWPLVTCSYAKKLEAERLAEEQRQAAFRTEQEQIRNRSEKREILRRLKAQREEFDRKAREADPVANVDTIADSVLDELTLEELQRMAGHK